MPTMRAVQVPTKGAAFELVERELPHKPDYIKVWFIHRPGDDLAAQEAIVRATAEAAHAAGLRLAVHATELVVAKSALRAGADILVHSVQDVPVDDEFIALARARMSSTSAFSSRMPPRCSATRRGSPRLFECGWRVVSPVWRTSADRSGTSKCAMPRAPAQSHRVWR